jgi:hypothetical protein
LVQAFLKKWWVESEKEIKGNKKKMIKTCDNSILVT